VLRLLAYGYLLFLSFSQGCSPQKYVLAPQRVLSGIVYVVGNEPFPRLLLESESGCTYTILADTSSFYRKLKSLQGRKLRLVVRPNEAPADTSTIRIERYELAELP